MRAALSGPALQPLGLPAQSHPGLQQTIKAYSLMSYLKPNHLVLAGEDGWVEHEFG